MRRNIVRGAVVGTAALLLGLAGAGSAAAAVKPNVQVSSANPVINGSFTVSMPECTAARQGSPAVDGWYRSSSADARMFQPGYFIGDSRQAIEPGVLGRAGQTVDLSGHCRLDDSAGGDAVVVLDEVDTDPVPVTLGYPSQLVGARSFQDGPGPYANTVTVNIGLNSSGGVTNRLATNPDGTGYRLVAQSDGNLVEYAPDGRVVWQSNTRHSAGVVFELNDLGRPQLVGSGTKLWGPAVGEPGSSLRVQTDGNIVLYSAANKPLWWTGADRSTSQLNAGATLLPGQSKTSANGRFRLAMQTDGNLVLYRGNTALWSSGTGRYPSNARATVQTDGNFVVYGSDAPRWQSKTRTGAKLVVQDDGNVVLYTASNKVAWASNTRG